MSRRRYLLRRSCCDAILSHPVVTFRYRTNKQGSTELWMSPSCSSRRKQLFCHPLGASDDPYNGLINSIFSNTSAQLIYICAVPVGGGPQLRMRAVHFFSHSPAGTGVTFLLLSWDNIHQKTVFIGISLFVLPRGPKHARRRCDCAGCGSV